MKCHFRILQGVCEYPVVVQGKLFAALCALHNFIIANDDADEEYWSRVQPALTGYECGWYDMDVPDLHGAVSTRESNEADQRWDQIAQAMWASYQDELGHWQDWMCILHNLMYCTSMLLKPCCDYFLAHFGLPYDVWPMRCQTLQNQKTWDQGDDPWACPASRFNATLCLRCPMPCTVTQKTVPMFGCFDLWSILWKTLALKSVNILQH